jgi:hypothetical protein
MTNTMPEEESLPDKCRAIHEILESLPEYTYKTPKSELPTNGIYFFYEDGEFCTHVNERQKRIVRVGTHRVDENFRNRINSHYRGNKNSSVFRKHLGGALIRRKDPKDKRLKQWLEQDAPTFQEMETEVTTELKEHFSFRCIPVEYKDKRLRLEEELIATMANCDNCKPSENWLGNFAADELVRKSGLWNHQHVTSKNYASEKTIGRLEDLTNLNSSNTNRFKINDSLGTTAKREIVLVTTCTGSKNKDIENSVNFSEFKSPCLNCTDRSLSSCLVIRGWMEKLQNASERVQAIDLYEGSGFPKVREAFLKIDEDKFEKDLWIISAGYGLLSYNEGVTKYNATFSSDGKENFIKCPAWWDLLTEYNDDYLYRRINSLSTDDAVFITLGNDYAKRVMKDIKKINPLCKVYFIVSSTVHTTLKELDKHHNVEFINVRAQSEGSKEYYDPAIKTLFEVGSKYSVCQNVLKQVAIDFSKDGNLNVERVLKKLGKKAEQVQKIDNPSNQSVNKVMGSGKMKQADKIRDFVCRNYIDPARKTGVKQITVQAGEIDRKMRLGRVPNVNNALSGKKLQEMCEIRLIGTGGSSGSTTATYTYEILSKGGDTMVEEDLGEPKTAEIRDTTQGLKCPGCGFINDKHNKFCEECGLQLNVCPNCENPVKPTSKFCNKCGTRLQ